MRRIKPMPAVRHEAPSAQSGDTGEAFAPEPHLTLVSGIESFPTPVQYPVLSAVTRQILEELGRVMGIMTGVVDYGAHSGSGEIALETSASVNMAIDYGLTLTRNLTYIESLLAGERMQYQKCDVTQLLIDTFSLNQKYLVHRQTFPKLMVDTACMAELDPNAVHHVVCTLLVRSGKRIMPGGSVTLALTPHPNEDVVITYTETKNPLPVDLSHPELAVCKMLIEAHGGTFEVTSRGDEHTFRILIPAPNGSGKLNLVNRRRHRRARVRLPVHLQFKGDSRETLTHSVNLSTSGVMLSYLPDRFPRPPVVGDEISLRIVCSRDRALQIRHARIVTTLTHAFGIEFLDIDEKSRRIIGGIVKSRPY